MARHRKTHPAEPAAPPPEPPAVADIPLPPADLGDAPAAPVPPAPAPEPEPEAAPVVATTDPTPTPAPAPAVAAAPVGYRAVKLARYRELAEQARQAGNDGLLNHWLKRHSELLKKKG